MSDKVIKDGKVAVLYSPGFGAGWQTWNEGFNCLFTPDVIKWVLGKKKGSFPDFKNLYGDGFYAGGADDLEVAWIPVGTQFRVEEYDGSESIRLFDEYKFFTA